MDNQFDLIKKNLFRFIVLTDDEFKIFCNYCTIKHVKKKEFILRAGDVCDYTGFVNKGCFRVFTTDLDGTEHIMQFSIEDYWIGDMYSYLTDNASQYSIEACEDSEILLIGKYDMEKVYEALPKMERFFRILVQRSFVNLQNRITGWQMSTALDKYYEMIRKYPGIELRISQKHIASYLGITPESLSRIKNKLHQKKKILS